MKILFCSLNPLDLKLGASKVIMELSEEMTKLNWDVHLASDSEIAPDLKPGLSPALRMKAIEQSLKSHLIAHAAEYDVVDFDHAVLPFKRSLFSRKPLFVARSVLLAQHFERIKLPHFRGLRPAIGRIVYGRQRRNQLQEMIQTAEETCHQADLINVSNEDDRSELIRRGHAPEKVIVIPFGLTEKRFSEFQVASPPRIIANPGQQRIAFVGTFDTRKGGPDFPAILEKVHRHIPHTVLKIMGPRYRDASEVVGSFPKKLRSFVEVISQFEPVTLPALLADCSVGIFPSYIEGFGFGILEMLAAGLPVFAYDAPGAPMMLPPTYLVKRGDTEALALKTVNLLRDPEALLKQSRWAQERAKEFLWSRAARLTNDIYLERLAQSLNGL